MANQFKKSQHLIQISEVNKSLKRHNFTQLNFSPNNSKHMHVKTENDQMNGLNHNLEAYYLEQANNPNALSELQQLKRV